MSKKTEMREGEEAAERFKEVTAKIMATPKSEIDKRAADKREKRQSEETEQGAE